MAALTIPASSLARKIRIDVRITGMRTWKVRLWLSARLFKLAALVAGTGISIEIAGTGEGGGG